MSEEKLVTTIGVVMHVRLIAARTEAGLSQTELAELVGVGQSAVSQWERGETTPRDDKKVLLGRVLNVDPRDLFPLEIAS